MNKTVLELKASKTGEETPEAMAQVLASFSNIKTKYPICLEIALIDQSIKFFVVCNSEFESFVSSQLLSQYPRLLIIPVKEIPLLDLLNKQEDPAVEFGQMKLTSSHLYPLKTFQDFKEGDSIAPLLGLLSKMTVEDIVLVQIIILPTDGKWQRKGQVHIEKKSNVENEDVLNLKTYSKQVGDKVNYPGFKTGIRILVKSQNKSLLNLVAACFSSLNNIAGNSLSLTYPSFWQKKNFFESILNRTGEYIPDHQILNVMELATLYHPPNKKLATVVGISWSASILSDAPENLPVAQNIPEEERHNVNFFGKTEYKNQNMTFGIWKKDRSRHMYIIGKTGTGKSTLITNLAINDIRNREGMAIIDPHGDTAESLLDYIPSYRVNDVVYLNPADVEHPFHINPLEITGTDQKDLIASGIVGIFYKLYAHSWGPRLEYILRNTILTLLEVPNATLLMVPEILTNDKFRKKVVSNMQDPVLKAFWINEFDKMQSSQSSESVAPILNKVGQFLSSQMIRNIVGAPKSTINLDEIMNEGKILILNLSQGKVGEDNSALLGAMLITKLQIAAMNRASMPESERRDFYLYVDEFQNFATSSFIKILSEARKYHLNLILANQYTAQIDEGVRSAIFGNVGTIMSFLIGAQDAPLLAQEFGESFTVNDLLALGNFRLLIKMAINNVTSNPFLAYSLPLPQNKNQNREKVIEVSRQHYNRKINNDKFDKDKDGKEKIRPISLNSQEILNRLFTFHLLKLHFGSK